MLLCIQLFYSIINHVHIIPGNMLCTRWYIFSHGAYMYCREDRHRNKSSFFSLPSLLSFNHPGLLFFFSFPSSLLPQGLYTCCTGLFAIPFSQIFPCLIPFSYKGPCSNVTHPQRGFPFSTLVTHLLFLFSS